jgi:hypothetical protein
MKVRSNSNKAVTHPRTLSRRQRALAQRQRELKEWQDPESERVQELRGDDRGHEQMVNDYIAAKIQRAEADIAALTKKGVTS